MTVTRGIKDDVTALWKRLKSPVDMRDCLVFGGIGCASYGINMIYPPGAFIFSGLALFWLGVR